MDTEKRGWITWLAMSMVLATSITRTIEAADVEYQICLDAFPELPTSEDRVEPLIQFTFPLSMEVNTVRTLGAPIALNFAWAINRKKGEQVSYWELLAPENAKKANSFYTEHAMPWAFALSREWELERRMRHFGFNGFISAGQTQLDSNYASSWSPN